MVMISSIEEVAQVVLQVHHQHRLRGWTLSTDSGTISCSEEARHQCSDWTAAATGMVWMRKAHQKVGSSPSLER